MTDKQLIYILSDERSGSTALDYVLSTHPDLMTVGELRLLNHFYNKKGKSRLAKWRCTCGVNVSECPFWDEVLGHTIQTTGGIAQDVTTMVGEAGESCNILAVYDSIYALHEKSIIDSSKHLRQLEYIVAHSTGWDIRIIHLTRDPVGVVESKIKWSRKLNGSSRSKYNYLVKWFFRQLRTKHFLKSIDSRMWTSIRYEDFILGSDGCLSHISEFIGLQNKFKIERNLSDLHTIAGTPTKVYQSQFRLDCSLRKESRYTRSMFFLWVARCFDKISSPKGPSCFSPNASGKI